MAVVGVDHTSFTVSDVDRAVAWFSALLGADPIIRKRSTDRYMSELVGYPDCELEYAYFQLPGGSMLELVEYFQPAPDRVDLETRNIGIAHLCLIVDDIHAEYQRLSAVASFRSPAPVAKDAGPNRGGYGLYLRGPDEITIELAQPPPAAGGD